MIKLIIFSPGSRNNPIVGTRSSPASLSPASPKLSEEAFAITPDHHRGSDRSLVSVGLTWQAPGGTYIREKLNRERNGAQHMYDL